MSAPKHRINLLDTVRLHVPYDDDPHSASVVANEAVGRTLELIDELETSARQHGDAAPASAKYLSDLGTAVARATMDWIKQWPG